MRYVAVVASIIVVVWKIPCLGTHERLHFKIDRVLGFLFLILFPLFPVFSPFPFFLWPSFSVFLTFPLFICPHSSFFLSFLPPHSLCFCLLLMPFLMFLLSPTSLHLPFHSLSPVLAPNLFFSIYSFSSLVVLHPPDPGGFIFQAPPAQTFPQISQGSPSHSAAQMKCSESFLVGRIPSLASLVSHTQYIHWVIKAFL